jgi:hypothetical protein
MINEKFRYKKHQQLTANIGKRGDSGCIQRPVSVSAFSTVDNDELRNPRLPILANRCKQARDNDVRKLKHDIFNLVFVKRHACPASFYERTL